MMLSLNREEEEEEENAAAYLDREMRCLLDKEWKQRTGSDVLCTAGKRKKKS